MAALGQFTYRLSPYKYPASWRGGGAALANPAAAQSARRMVGGAALCGSPGECGVGRVDCRAKEHAFRVLWVCRRARVPARTARGQPTPWNRYHRCCCALSLRGIVQRLGRYAAARDALMCVLARWEDFATRPCHRCADAVRGDGVGMVDHAVSISGRGLSAHFGDSRLSAGTCRDRGLVLPG